MMIRFEDLQRMLRASTTHLYDVLSGLYFIRRGKVHELHIIPQSIQQTTSTTGVFTVRFKVNYTQGCQDLSYDEDETLTIEFTIENQFISFSPQTMPDRGMDEF
jgi:hypothetical protein